MIVSSTHARPWDIDALCATPSFERAPDFDSEGVQALFYSGLPYRGRPTRVFALYGLPKVLPAGKVPAMVLVHGGGGTAFADWVRLWNSRGYAALAIDTCGNVPRGEYGKWERDVAGGPPGWGGFDQVSAPVSDQWTYHAVANVVLAHSLIRSFPEVDAGRIGVTGISWGGYLTCMAVSVDPRFKFAAIVYGCGFLGENSAWLETFQRMPDGDAQFWLSHWDPSVYLPSVDRPMLWVTGTNDFAYPLDSFRRSYRLPTGPRTLAVRLRMHHGHDAGGSPEEIHAFANHHLNGGPPLPRITSQGRNGATAWIGYESVAPMANAEILYTTATGKWLDREWFALPARLDTVNRKATAELPEGVTVYYFNLTDANGLMISGEHLCVPPAGQQAG